MKKIIDTFGDFQIVEEDGFYTQIDLSGCSKPRPIGRHLESAIKSAKAADKMFPQDKGEE
jgi:hypothetical protein